MKNEAALDNVMKHLANDIKLFIELSLQEPDTSWDEWLSLVTKTSKARCWEKKKCKSKGCPAYLNPDGRCWLIAGTMCGGRVRGEFALKYKSCTECEVYREAVFEDPATEIYEHVLTLVHSFRATQAKLKTMATRDSLTGLYNRAFFNEVVLNEVERTKRYGNAFSIIMLDVDNFKWINDNYGHLFGDKILRDCAALMMESVRTSDIVVRYGGDEFLVVLPEDGQEKCFEVMQRIKTKVDEWNLLYSDPDYCLSVSAGCANFEPGMDIMSVLSEADNKMYQDKKR